ncbi:MAG: 50S ribosomal protein L9 [Devosiaceae bacterium]|nr:50S ribosomal protein L9 [Devosiaceae bacterium]
MKVILLERVGRLGALGDEVNVKNGFGRNFLLPQGKAIRANEVNRARFEKERAEIEKRNEERKNQAAGIADGLNGVSIIMIRQASEAGTLYGSVSSRDIADGLSDKGFSVTRNAVDLPLPIKTVGIHEIALNLHADVAVSVNVNVARSESEAERQEAGEDMTVFDFDDNENAAQEEVEVADDAEDAPLEDAVSQNDESEAEIATSEEDADKA